MIKRQTILECFDCSWIQWYYSCQCSFRNI